MVHRDRGRDGGRGGGVLMVKGEMGSVLKIAKPRDRRDREEERERGGGGSLHNAQIRANVTNEIQFCRSSE